MAFSVPHNARFSCRAAKRGATLYRYFHATKPLLIINYSVSSKLNITTIRNSLPN